MNFCTHCGAPRADLVQPCSRCGVAPAAPTQPVSLGKPPAGQAVPPPVSFEKASEVTLPATPNVAPPPPSFAPPPVTPPPVTPPPIAPLPVAPLPPLGPPGGRGRRGRAVLLVLLAAVLAVVVGVGTALLLARGDDGPTAGEADRATEDGVSTPAGGAGPATDDTASGAAEQAAYTCWDGEQADDLDDCGEPQGAEGLRWVFPDADGPRCSATMGNRGAEADCRLRASSGGQVRVHYSEWTDWDAAYAEYSAQDVQGAVTRWRDFFRWYISPRRGDWEHKVALLYRDAPWSVTVYGHTAADRDEVLRQLATRPVSDLMGERKK